MTARRFSLYEGDLIGLPTDKNHLVFRWAEAGCKVLFSVARQGNGASCHLASDKAGLRVLKQAINEFWEYLMWLFEWCTMVMAKAKKASLGRLLEKCGFSYVGRDQGITAYVRCR